MEKNLSVINSLDHGNLLKHPGDKLTAVVTKTERKVIKLETAEEGKYSATLYKNGTLVETRTTHPKK